MPIHQRDSVDLGDLPTLDPLPSPSRPSPTALAKRLVPGVALSAGIAAMATALGGFVPIVGAPVFAIVAGIIVATVRAPSEQFAPGLAFAGKKVLQGSIMLLGLELSLRQVLATGERSLPVLVGTLLVALAVAWLAGRALHLGRDLDLLIGVGTAICGASAIAATDAVIDADEADVSFAVATIFIFNVVAVLAYPTVGHALGLSQHAFGLWAGTAINDVSSVVAASTVYGHSAASYAVVVKLTRTLAIIPITLGLSAWRSRQGATRTLAKDIAMSDRGGRVWGARGNASTLRRVFPLFVLGFLVAVGANTLGLVPEMWHRWLSDVATWMITAALAAIGLSTKLGHIRRTGPRPILLGAILWVVVGVVSLALQAATGTL